MNERIYLGIKTLHFKVKASEKILSGAVYVCIYSNKVKGKHEKQVTHTYALIKAKIFMETTKWNKEKIDIITSQVKVIFFEFRVFLFGLLSS